MAQSRLVGQKKLNFKVFYGKIKKHKSLLAYDTAKISLILVQLYDLKYPYEIRQSEDD